MSGEGGGGALRPGTAVAVVCRSLDGGPLGRRRGEPVTCGLPWPRGVLVSIGELALFDATGARLPLQARALERWADGSVRWALLDWRADLEGEETRFTVGAVDASSGALSPVPESPLAVEREPASGAVAVDTGSARFAVRPGGPLPFDRATVGGRPALAPERGGLAAEDGSGRRYRARIERVEIDEAGPVRVALRLVGSLVAERGGESLADLEVEQHFWAASSTVRLRVAVTNPRAAGHAGGRWRLGAAGAVEFRDLALAVALPPGEGAPELLCSPEAGRAPERFALPFELYQDSSGGENWKSRVHVDRRGEVPLAFRGYRLAAGEARREGLRATPAIRLERGEARLGVAMRHFWQSFPKAVEADGDALTVRLFPPRAAAPQELQGGERKTHELWLALGRDGNGDPLPEWCRSPALARAEPEWYAAAEALPRLVPRARDPHAGYCGLVDQAIEGEETFERKREAIDEYGWRHFGDLWADHEAVFADGPGPIVSHYNNQYDAVRGFAAQFLRSGDPRWFRFMDELARHVADIDVYHTDRDKSAYNHGLFWHTVHYVDAGTSTHRSYPDAPGVAGGGPAAGHLYAEGLALHYLLTGSRASRETALELGRYAIDADDGRRTVFRFLDRGPTGHASESGADRFHGPGRSAANAISTLLDAHRLSGDRRFLDKAEELVRRAIHPADDVAARDLLDAERRWYYTMFLQSLGKYLDHKAERGELDGMYAWARESLLAYARWAAEHEVPYLERPEVLEFPTETWAAQDLRKAEVFDLAALHAESAEERGRFRERARFFFRDAVERLAGMPTRSLCRPVVILLGCGGARAWHEERPEAAAARGPEGLDFGAPREFVPQKRRALRRLGWLAAALAAAALALVLAVAGGALG